ncbi:MAG: hypothetical protein D6784_06695 [Chloroflexi bacterium]|nr:MAG: hypothetical protein D6784_06695 [Chloroflexota bacterium]
MIPVLASIGTLSVIVLCYILARLSERFGAVVKLPPYYRYYYAALGLLSIALIVQIILSTGTAQEPGNSPWFVLFGYHLPMVSGVTVCLLVTWKYWNWLLSEGDE